MYFCTMYLSWGVKLSSSRQDLRRWPSFLLLLHILIIPTDSSLCRYLSYEDGTFTSWPTDIMFTREMSESRSFMRPNPTTGTSSSKGPTTTTRESTSARYACMIFILLKWYLTLFVIRRKNTFCVVCFFPKKRGESVKLSHSPAATLVAWKIHVSFFSFLESQRVYLLKCTLDLWLTQLESKQRGPFILFWCLFFCSMCTLLIYYKRKERVARHL